MKERMRGATESNWGGGVKTPEAFDQPVLHNERETKRESSARLTQLQQGWKTASAGFQHRKRKKKFNKPVSPQQKKMFPWF